MVGRARLGFASSLYITACEKKKIIFFMQDLYYFILFPFSVMQ